jgi:uncharacterized damage-inducible protein DinB
MAPYALAIEFTPAILKQIICDIPLARYAEALGPDRFTLTEMIAHLADFDEIFLDRMVIAHERPGSYVEGIDETQRAIEKHYSIRDLYHELDVFANRRRDTVDFLRGLNDEDYQHHFEHSERGRLTIQDQLNMLSGHDLYHIHQATQYLNCPR